MLTTESRSALGENESKFIIGQSGAIQEVCGFVRATASNSAPVLLKGESGTGKEYIARAIHQSGAHASVPFSKVVGISLDPKSFFKALSLEGTIYVEEVSDIPVTIQAKVVDIFEEKFASGNKRLYPARLIAGTAQNLELHMKAKEFREDLYHILSVVSIFLPPLRERRDDIPVLADYFLKKFGQAYEKKITHISEDAVSYWRDCAFPGNVDELKSAVEKAVVFCNEDVLRLQYLRLSADKRFPESLPESVESLERQMISQALTKTGGNQKRASELLGITVRILGYKLKCYGYK